MSDKFFSGVWKGQYVYGPQYSQKVQETAVDFRITMTVTDGIVTGTVSENLPLSAPATIEGFIDGNMISFVKKYACAWSVDDYGNVLEFPDEPSHEIHYTGSYQEDAFSGDWEIFVSQVEVYTGMIEAPYSGSGYWTMEWIGKCGS